MKLDEPLTFVEAAKAIHWEADRNGSHKPAARRLLRLALRREREMGRRFIVRDSAGRPFRVTLGALTRYMPELRPSRVDTLAATIRPLLVEIEARAQEIVTATLDERVEPELQRLHDRDENLAEELAQLVLAVRALTKGPAGPVPTPATEPRKTTRNQTRPYGNRTGS